MRAASNKQRKAMQTTVSYINHIFSKSSSSEQYTTKKMASQSAACASEGVKHTNHRDPGPRTKFDPYTRWWAKKIHRYTRRDTQPRAATAKPQIATQQQTHDQYTKRQHTHMEAQRITSHHIIAMFKQTRMAWVSWSRMDHRNPLGRQT